MIKSTMMKWAGHVARMGEKRNVGKPEGKRSLGRRRWIDNIKMDLLEIGLGVVDRIGLAQDRYRKLPSGCTACGLSSGTWLRRVS
jgi:hypothetical protein